MTAFHSISNSISQTFYGQELLDFVKVFDETIQVVCCARQQDAQIAQYLELLAANQQLSALEHKTVYQLQKSMDWSFLPSAQGKEAFIADIEFLVDVYSELLGCDRVGLRIEVLNKAMCPRFHIDKVGIRLLTTYCGVGTQWLSDYQGALTQINEQAVTISQAEAFDVVLLKGSLWPNNQQAGAIHRSPAVEQTRVLLALDALWD